MPVNGFCIMGYDGGKKGMEGSIVKVVRVYRASDERGRPRIVRGVVEGSGVSGGSVEERVRALGEMLREHREERALSQEEFARLAGVSRTTLSNIERGHAFPSARIRRKLAEAMGVSPGELWRAGRDEDRHRTPGAGGEQRKAV